MEEDRTWSVTVTGKALAGFEPESVWQRAANMMKFELGAFRERILERAPLTLKAVSQIEACRQRDALIDCGAEAVALDNPRGRYVWLQLHGKVCGPVSEAYARSALDKGSLPGQTHACIKGESAWQSLQDLLGVRTPPAYTDDVAAGMSFSAWDASAMDNGSLRSSPAMNAYAKLPENLPSVYGGFWMRLAAMLVDVVIIWLLLFAIMMAMLMTGAAGGAVDSRVLGQKLAPYCVVLMFVLPWLYFALFESSARQATPGKLALGLRVTDEDGRRIGFSRALGRNLGRFLSNLIVYVGYMMAGWTSRKQALHDLVAGTFVVNKSGLEAWRQGHAQKEAAMPAWAIILIVFLGGFFVAVPVLAAIAIPAYQEYLVRAQTNEAVTATEQAREIVARAMLSGNGMPTDNAQAGLGSPNDLHGLYVSSVEIANGDVVARFGGRATAVLQNKNITFTPFLSDGRVNWSCTSYGIPLSDLPLICRSQ
jgi:uncharacterized RDD family membrane protein YckC/Tfp pilus assembly major pilin PilA